MAREKDWCPILIVYFEDKVKGFLKRIPFYFLNAWFEKYPKLKLTNFGTSSACNSLGEYRSSPLAIQKNNIPCQGKVASTKLGTDSIFLKHGPELYDKGLRVDSIAFHVLKTF